MLCGGKLIFTESDNYSDSVLGQENVFNIVKQSNNLRRIETHNLKPNINYYQALWSPYP